MGSCGVMRVYSANQPNQVEAHEQHYPRCRWGMGQAALWLVGSAYAGTYTRIAGNNGSIDFLTMYTPSDDPLFPCKMYPHTRDNL